MTNLTKKLILVSVVLSGLLIPSQANAEWRDELPDNLRMFGRYFWAGGYSFDRPYLDEGMFSEANVRMNGRYVIDDEWNLEFAWQIDGSYFESLSMRSITGSEGLVNLSWEIDEKTNWRVRHLLDRLQLNYQSGDFTLDLGRQRLAWGTTFTMSFMDMFHPIRPGDPFVPEQPGTDSVRLRIATGPVSGWDLLYAWFDDEGREAIAAKYHNVYGDFESALSVGRIMEEDFIAFQTTGDVKDVGIRIEAAWWDTKGESEPYRFALESDYAPNSSTYLSGEIFYNGPGADNPMDYDLENLVSGGLYPGRWYAGTRCSYNPGGLTTLGLLGLANLSDDSWFGDFAIQHSVSDLTDIRIGFQHYEGRTLSEYGALPDIIYIISTTYY